MQYMFVCHKTVINPSVQKSPQHFALFANLNLHTYFGSVIYHRKIQGGRFDNSITLKNSLNCWKFFFFLRDNFEDDKI